MARGDILGMNPDGSAIVDDGRGGTLDVAAEYAGDAVRRPVAPPVARVAPPIAPRDPVLDYAGPSLEEAAAMHGDPDAGADVSVITPAERADLAADSGGIDRSVPMGPLEAAAVAEEANAAALSALSDVRARDGVDAAREAMRRRPVRSPTMPGEIPTMTPEEAAARAALPASVPRAATTADGFRVPTAADYAGGSAAASRDQLTDIMDVVGSVLPTGGTGTATRSAAEVAAGAPAWSTPLEGGDPLDADYAAALAAERAGLGGAAPATGAAAPGAAAPRAPGGATSRGPRGTGGAGNVPAPFDEGAAFVDAMAARPRDDAPLFVEPTESPLDRALGRNAEATRLAQRRAEITAAGYVDTRDALAGAEAARAANEADRRAAMGEARDRWRGAMDRATSINIDPEGWYHDRGVLGTIAAAISVGMGTIGEAFGGGTSQALNIITASIDRDLDAQAQRLDSAFRAADGEMTALGLMSDEFSSRDGAIAATRAGMLESAAARVDEMIAGTASEEAAMSGAAMRDQLLQEAAAAQAAGMQAEIDAAIANRTAMAEMRSAEAEATRDERRAMGGGVAEAAPVTDAQASMFNRALASGNSREESARVAGIDPSMAPRDGGPFAISDSADNAGNVAALSGALERLAGLVPDDGGDVPGVGMTGGFPAWVLSDDGRAVREEIAYIGDLLGRLRSGAAISTTEETRFLSIIGGATTDAALRRGIARVGDEIRARTTRRRRGGVASSDIDAATSAVAGGLVEVD